MAKLFVHFLYSCPFALAVLPLNFWLACWVAFSFVFLDLDHLPTWKPIYWRWIFPSSFRDFLPCKNEREPYGLHDWRIFTALFVIMIVLWVSVFAFSKNFFLYAFLVTSLCLGMLVHLVLDNVKIKLLKVSSK